jgi:hypothetical protein
MTTSSKAFPLAEPGRSSRTSMRALTNNSLGARGKSQHACGPKLRSSTRLRRACQPKISCPGQIQKRRGGGSLGEIPDVAPLARHRQPLVESAHPRPIMKTNNTPPLCPPPSPPLPSPPPSRCACAASRRAKSRPRRCGRCPASGRGGRRK